MDVRMSCMSYVKLNIQDERVHTHTHTELSVFSPCLSRGSVPVRLAQPQAPYFGGLPLKRGTREQGHK